MERPSIQQFFNDKTIFITGGTGFLGKVLIEKLLRSCYDLKKIYILTRSKNGQNAENRLQEFFESQLFESLKTERGDFAKKLIMVNGDCELENLGLKNEDYKLLVEEVEVVFHVAATVRFNEKLPKATFINVRATRDLLEMGRKMSKLKAFVHVSTAFSFCPQPVIDERFYKVSLDIDDLLNIIDGTPEHQLTKMTPVICKPWPNTYTLTKAVAEDTIRKRAGDLPIAIVRPSVILASIKEPVEGWIDNIYGPTGLFLGISLGVVRTCVFQENCFADQVPVDFVANNIIAAAWNLGFTKNNGDVPIYNCVSSADNHITWGDSQTLSQYYATKYPSTQKKWHVVFQQAHDTYTFAIWHFLLHMIPAYFGDLLLALLGQKPSLVKMYQKIEQNVGLLSYFTTRQWIFKNDNDRTLLNSLSEDDRTNFGFDCKDIDWHSFAASYVRGARFFLLKEKLETVPKAKRKAFVLKIAHYLIVSLLCYFVFKILLSIFRFL